MGFFIIKKHIILQQNINFTSFIVELVYCPIVWEIQRINVENLDFIEFNNKVCDTGKTMIM